MYLSPPYDVAGPSLLLGLGFTIAALAIMFALIVIVESTVMQLMSWGALRHCLKDAFWMNLASTLIGFFFLALVPRFGYWGLLLAWAISVIIEALVLGRLNRQAGRKSWLVALVANLVSYLLLMLPTYLYSQS